MGTPHLVRFEKADPGPPDGLLFCMFTGPFFFGFFMNGFVFYSLIMKRFILAIFLVLISSDAAYSQLYQTQYRPPNQDWRELKTGHFRILFPAESESVAFQSAKILEREYPKARKLVGGELHNFPVILNTYNDLSNGFVTPMNFRAEVEIPPIKGKTMNPRSGNWLELVLPHELVHAMHMSVNPSSVSSLAGLFSPDFRRSIHTAAPFGVFEGLAVEYESHWVKEEGGRGNYPYFTNQFVSNFTSDQRWSMGQLVHISSSTLPYNRHYIGGYEFTNWLLKTFGNEVLQNAIGFHYKWPFLGFGSALRHTTGLWPSGLHRRFEADIEEQLPDSSSNRTLPVPPQATSLDFWQKGPVFRRPVWLDEHTLLMHGQFYNAPTGFYTYDLNRDRLHLVHESRTVEDYRFTYEPENHSLYFSDYVADTFYDHTFVADLFHFNLENNTRTRITKNQRVFAPSPGNPFLALRSEGPRNSVVSVNRETGDVSSFFRPGEEESVEELLYHPSDYDLLAVIMKKGTSQGLWVTNSSDLQQHLAEPPAVIFENGSVFDLAWHPAEKKLLFSSDHTGVLNIYEFDLDKHTVRQLTNSSTNTFEGSYSPNGGKIAYIEQDEGKHLPKILNREYFPDNILQESLWSSGSPVQEDQMKSPDPMQFPDSGEWTSERYKAGIKWWLPRSYFPYYENVEDNVYELGVRLSSTEPLSSRAYDMTLTSVQNRFWFDLNIMNTSFYPGFGINVFNTPSFPLIWDNDRLLEDPTRFLLQQRGVSMKIPFRFIFERNTRFTSLSISPKYKIYQSRFYRLNEPYKGLNDYGLIHTAMVSFEFNYRLRQFRRDLQPNAGWSITTQFELDLNDLQYEFEFDNYSFEGTFKNRGGIRINAYKFLAPFARWNQSLRLGTQILMQSRFPKFNSQRIVSNAFSDNVFSRSNNLSTFESRYTIPLAYPDQGGLLVPAYLSSVYLVLYSQTVGNLNLTSFTDIVSSSRTAIGAGIRTRIRLSNFNVDLGIGFGYEPSRDQWSLLVGDF